MYFMVYIVSSHCFYMSMEKCLLMLAEIILHFDIEKQGEKNVLNLFLTLELN
jgi:hypothetical protein